MTTDEVDVKTQSSQNSRLELARLLGEVVGNSLKFGGGVLLIVRLLESAANNVADHGKGQRDEEKHQCNSVDRVVSNIEIGNITSRCLLYTSPSPRDQRGSRMPSSA